jgi:uncharacterized protein (TIGR02246 family)
MTETAHKAQSPAEICKLFEKAWNAHDMVAFGALFEPHATFVSRFGHCWQGRDEIVARHGEIHSTIYRDCTIANRLLAVDLVTDDVAVAFVRSLVKVGAAMPTGPREFSSLFTYVATWKKEDGWHIRAAANVALADPRTGEPVVEHH